MVLTAGLTGIAVISTVAAARVTRRSTVAPGRIVFKTFRNWLSRLMVVQAVAGGTRTPVITAVYTDMQDVVDLIDDLKGEWLQNNRENGYPISVVLSGLFDDARRCCQRTGSQEHTYLHSLGFFGRTEGLPSEDELEVITMCGHGMIAANRVRWLVEGVRAGETNPAEAAENVARPCLCGIVNRERAAEVFRRLVEAS